ncbi:MAG TPA: peptidylprolyl isomerase [Rhizomicrobium sp.]
MRKQALADPKLLERLAQLAVVRVALLKKAEQEKWPQRPDVAREIAEARNAIVLRTYLASVTKVPRGYPSEADIRSAYELNRSSFMVPRSYHVEQIFIASPYGDKNAATAQKRAAQLAQMARGNPARFEDLARKNSQHQPSASKGGDLGWVVESQIPPPMLSKIAGLRRGEVSDPIRSAVGWHIVRLLDTKPAGVRPLSEVRDSIAASLRQSRAQKEQQNYIAAMMQKNPIRLNPERLRQLFAAAR